MLSDYEVDEHDLFFLLFLFCRESGTEELKERLNQEIQRFE
jgi:hypothetical protein